MISIAKPIIDNEYAYDFDAHAFDSAGGLQYKNNRHCDRPVGRWLSVDPVGCEADEVNLHSYPANRPE